MNESDGEDRVKKRRRGRGEEEASLKGKKTTKKKVEMNKGVG